MMIVDRKPSRTRVGYEVIIFDRGEGIYERWATGLVGPVGHAQLDHIEWFWGHYFKDIGAAGRDFLER